VRAGTFKSVMVGAAGDEHVTGFQVGGDVLGVDGLARQRHESTAIALEDSEVLVMPYGATAPATAFTAELHHLMARLLSREIVRERQRSQLLAHRSAETRVAAFLLDLSQRMQARGYSETEFHLRMTREEIGSYLGLQIETVSRALGALQNKRLLQTQGRRMRLLDPGALATVTRALR
jgi:CRP/FNR family transcriptional regulator